MPAPHPVQIADNILPSRVKSFVRPAYRRSFRTYHKLRVVTGYNYRSYDILGEKHKLYYTIETANTFSGLIDNGIIASEGIPIEVIKPNQQVETVIDIGAHYGIYSTLLSKVNPKSELYAFEPDEYNRNILSEVLEINGISGNIDDRVVSNKTGEVLFYTDEKKGSESHSISGDDNLTKVEKKSIALSDLFEQKNIDSSFLKIDSEGAELEILHDIFPSSVEYLEGIVEIHPDKLSEPPSEVTNILKKYCDTVEFLTDTSPSHPHRNSIDHEYNRPMYRFELSNKDK